MSSGGEHRQVFFLLFFGAVCQDRVAAEAVVGGNDVTGGCAVFGKFLNCERRGQDVCAGAAVFLRYAHTHDAISEKLIDRFGRVLCGTVGFRRDRFHFVFCEFTDHFLDHLLLHG